MREHFDRADQHFLGEPAEYPGHPVTIAYLIVRTFPTWAAARATDATQTPAALKSMRIPGAGGNVYGAMTLLARLVKNPVPAELEFGNTFWRHCDDQEMRYPERWRRGQEQADAIKERLLTAVRDWPKDC